MGEGFVAAEGEFVLGLPEGVDLVGASVRLLSRPSDFRFHLAIVPGEVRRGYFCLYDASADQDSEGTGAAVATRHVQVAEASMAGVARAQDGLSLSAGVPGRRVHARFLLS